ncbi:MAG: DUF1772 domain-containing protein [Gammaproteobacteria bacterium]|nr:DUF1772 domain-containing protein [Gammaproteobacteria bacterium]
MNTLVTIPTVLALLGSLIIAGVFFAFSSFVMRALAHIPAAQGVRAMQSINVMVINRSFLGVFMGTAILSLVAFGLAAFHPGQPATPYLLAAAGAYVLGTFGVTVLFNVPLNDRLAATSLTQQAALDTWNHYLKRWTLWNHLRTGAAILAALLYLAALLQPL